MAFINLCVWLGWPTTHTGWPRPEPVALTFCLSHVISCTCSIISVVVMRPGESSWDLCHDMGSSWDLGSSSDMCQHRGVIIRPRSGLVFANFRKFCVEPRSAIAYRLLNHAICHGVDLCGWVWLWQRIFEHDKRKRLKVQSQNCFGMILKWTQNFKYRIVYTALTEAMYLKPHRIVLGRQWSRCTE